MAVQMGFICHAVCHGMLCHGDMSCMYHRCHACTTGVMHVPDMSLNVSCRGVM